MTEMLASFKTCSMPFLTASRVFLEVDSSGFRPFDTLLGPLSLGIFSDLEESARLMGGGGAGRLASRLLILFQASNASIAFSSDVGRVSPLFIRPPVECLRSRIFEDMLCGEVVHGKTMEWPKC